MGELVEWEKRGAVCVITLKNPPVNALGAGVRKGILDAVGRAVGDDAVSALVLAGDGRCFSGGADIREFGQPQQSPILPEVIETVESAPKPVVAALHGPCYGGGFELPLGCHFRIGDPSTRVALTEVKLGLIPGAGGTQRLPRLIGAEKALQIILSGDPVDAREALALGILDEIAETDLVAAAVAFAEARARDKGKLKRVRDLDVPPQPEGFFDAERKKIERRARGQIAPGHGIDSVENACTLSFDEGMEKERALFAVCRDSDQSRAQRHVFFAEREAAKIPDVPKDTPALPIRTAAVVGCGTMGGGIAMNFANAGIPVGVLETDKGALEKGLGVVRRNYAATVEKGRLSPADMETRLGLIEGVTDYGDLAGADIVIEAVFEDMDLKKQVFRALDGACKPEAIITTNTSTLDVDEIARATGRPDKVIGTHFFSPANVMRLMENVRGEKTSKQTIATVMALSKALGKAGVLVGVCDGFVGNRMYHLYSREAQFMLEEGALPELVDRVLYDFGFAMGPFAVGDVAGLDVGWRIRQERAKRGPTDERTSPIADRICEEGRFGQKTGAGWYRYEEGSRTPIPDPAVEEIILAVSGELGFQRRDISDGEILERCLYTLVNEGAKILDEGLALRPGDIDVIWIAGYGFPVHRGGPMFHADRLGPGAVY
ncbi:MAG: 3-hydroxyacyl-CoA dehydrogenase NAD-binding domain-containing protein, partial [Rhodospirillales bacterium]